MPPVNNTRRMFCTVKLLYGASTSCVFWARFVALRGASCQLNSELRAFFSTPYHNTISVCKPQQTFGLRYQSFNCKQQPGTRLSFQLFERRRHSLLHSHSAATSDFYVVVDSSVAPAFQTQSLCSAPDIHLIHLHAPSLAFLFSDTLARPSNSSNTLINPLPPALRIYHLSMSYHGLAGFI